MTRYGVKRWMYATVRWRGRLGQVMGMDGEWLYVDFLIDAKGNHYRKRWRRRVSRCSTVELVVPTMPLYSLWMERRWEAMQRVLAHRSARKALRRSGSK